ncbi:MAG: hypothetical protein IJC87_04460 [Clostridia bacterium]|nr:hypothetical protein [Clostridia bacterium]
MDVIKELLQNDAFIGGFFGLLGALLGTILGWLLAKINFGGITIKLTNIYDQQFYRNGSKYFTGVPGKLESEVYSVSFKFVIKLYNSNEKIKVIRDLQVQFIDNEGKILFSEDVKNYETQRCVNQHFWKIDDVGVVNIAGKAGIDIVAQISVGGNNVSQLYKAKRIMFVYNNEKFKTKNKCLCKSLCLDEPIVLEEEIKAELKGE